MKTGISLSFLSVQKVELSLPINFITDPTSGSILIGDYKLGHAPFPACFPPVLGTGLFASIYILGWSEKIEIEIFKIG